MRYTGLDSLVRDSARQLNRAGIGRGDRLAVILPNGPETATVFLAVSATAVCAPLNPAYSTREFAFYLGDLRPKAVLIADGMGTTGLQAAEELRVPVIRLVPHGREAGRFVLEGSAGGPAASPGFAEPEDTALVLHTSGTTSRPKLVPLTHRNLCASAENIRRTLALTGADRCLNVMPLFHIHGLVAAVLASLSAGASVVCTPGFVAPRFFDWLEEFAPSWYTAVPAMHQAILARAGRHGEIIARRPLRFIRSSSSALPPKVMSELEAAFGAPVIEAYGMTEAAHQVASNPLPPGKRKPGSVGLPAGPEIAVLDPEGRPLPCQRTGEIAIRGENVMRGYESNQEANRASFTGGWFRTGDQGRLDEAGYLFITGRIKEMINRGGEKISPREIDEVLLHHSGVSQAVAFAVPHESLGEEIGVAVVPKDGVTLRESDVREFAAGRLADFKIPRVVRIVPEIPKGATGKVQRIGLAAALGIQPAGDTDRESDEFAAPRTPLERHLARIWSEVLEIPRVGVRDDFFRLGGDSLLASQMLARVWRETGAGVAFAAFLDSPTIAAMAERMAAGPAAADAGLVVPIQTGAGGPPLWFLPGHQGNLVAGYKLARGLDSGQPLFGLVPPAVSPGSGPWQMEWLAEQYLAAVRARQAAGPYFLAGHCFGGYVAYEMARQLHGGGQQVGMLALIDSYCPWGSSAHRDGFFGRLRLAVKQLADRRGTDRWAYLLRRTQDAASWSWSRLRQFEYELAVSGKIPMRNSLHRSSYANLYAGKHYRPQELAIAAIVIRARERRPFLGWHGLVRGHIEVRDAPDHPLGLLDDETAQAAGRILQEALRRAQQGDARQSARQDGGEERPYAGPDRH